MEIPKMMEQVPIPQMNELSKALQQLLAKTSKKLLSRILIQQLSK